MAVYKPLSNSQIDDVVSDFLGRHPDRSAQIDSAIADQQQAARAAAAPAAAARAAGAAARPGGNRGANPGTQLKVDDFLSALNPVTNVARGINAVGAALGQETAADGAPANPVQWALNLLSTPVYVAGRVAEQVGTEGGHRKIESFQRMSRETQAGARPRVNPFTGEARDAQGRQLAPRQGDGDVIGALGEGVGNAAGLVGAASRGVAEGLGFRFDGQRAKTLGDVAAEQGYNKGVGDAVRGVGGPEPVATFAEGATGFAADLAVPIPGIGAVRGTAAGLKGAAGAARAGGGAAATVREFSAGKAAYEAQVAAKAASKAAAKAARRATKRGGGLSADAGVQADLAARAQTSAGEASAHADIAAAAASVGDDAGAEAAARQALVHVGGTRRFSYDVFSDQGRLGIDAPAPRESVDIGELQVLPKEARPAGVQPRLALEAPRARVPEETPVGRPVAEASPPAAAGSRPAGGRLTEQELDQARASRTALEQQAVDARLARDTPALRAAEAQLDDVNAAIRGHFAAESAQDGAAAVREATDALLPRLSTRAAERPTVDPQAILEQAAGAQVRPALITEAQGADLVHAVVDADNVAGARAAIAAVGKSKGGRELLGKQIGLDGRKVTVAQLLERAYTRRLTGDSKEYAQLKPMVDRIIAAGQAVKRGDMNADSLTTALADGVGSDHGLDVAAVLTSLQAARPAERPAILRDLLNAGAPEGGASFASFDEAMSAALAGDVSPQQMRLMLQALGVPSKATAEPTLRRLLGGAGVKRWTEVQAAIPSKVEVAATHGFDEDALTAAANVNTDAVQRAAAAEADGAARRADEVLPDGGGSPEVPEGAPLTVAGSPLRVPGRAQGIGDSLATILARYDLDPLNQEVNSAAAWRDMAQQILNVVNFPANAKRLTGAERGEYLYGRLMNRLTAGEAYLRSHGVMPAFRTGGQTWYVSFGQVLDHLEPATVKQAFFDLRYRLGEGQSAAQRQLYKQGLTVLPSTFGRGAAAAMRGADEAGILRAMQGGRASKFTESAEGAAALRRVAADMASPGYADTMRTLHDGQEVIALAFANRAADELIGPMASKFIEAVSTYGDRSQVTKLIREAAAMTAKIKSEGNSSLLRDLYAQRATNGLLGMLNDAEGATLRADLRAAADVPVSKALERVITAERARAAAPRVEDGRAPAAAPRHAAQEQTRLRDEGASNSRQLLDEQDDLARELVDELHAPGGREEVDLARVESLIEVQATMTRGKRVFDKIGVLFDGSHGMRDAKALLSQYMTGSHVASQLYGHKIAQWAVGDRRLLNSKVAPGIQGRLEGALGRKVTYEELHDFTRQWWSALAGHTTRESSLADDELRSALAAGAPADFRNGLPEVPPVPPEQVEMAVELKGLIDDVFSDVNGPLQRVQAGSDAIRRELSRYGVRDGKMPDRGVDIATQAAIWRTFDFSAGGSTPPLDTLLTWHRALEAATVPQSVGATFSKLLDHRAAGLSSAEARAQGWKRLDTKQEGRLISAHVPADSFFPPEAIAQLPYAEHLLQQAQRASIGGPDFQRFVVAPFDYVTGILKSSQTIWRPAHHVTNVSGELLINLMAGVNPKYVLQAPKVLRAAGMLQDVGEDVLEGLQRTHLADAADAGAGGLGDIAARVTVRGKVVELTHAQVAQLGIGRGALVTPRHARDALPGSEVSSALGREGVAKFRQANPLSQIDDRLGEFSATRDNMTRVPHFIHELEARSYASLDEAIARSADVVNRYHPTIQSLSHFEQKYVRRAIYFYTWMRLTAGTVLAHGLERPKDIAAVPLGQYELASANGLNPNSVGNPTPTDDPRVPSYMSQGLLGPSFQAGYSPLGSPEQPEEFGDTAHLWGFSLSAPQVDAIQGMFQGNAIASSNPLIGVPIQFALNAQPNSAVKPQDDPGAFLFQQSGAPYGVASALGYSSKDAPKDADEEELAEFNASQRGNQARSALNFALGAKFTDYTSLANQRNAKSESAKIRRAQLREQGYSESDIDTLVRQESRAAG